MAGRRIARPLDTMRTRTLVLFLLLLQFRHGVDMEPGAGHSQSIQKAEQSSLSQANSPPRRRQIFQPLAPYKGSGLENNYLQ